jgi:hypothetical protein
MVAASDGPPLSNGMVRACCFLGADAHLCCRPWKPASSAVKSGIFGLCLRLLVEMALFLVVALVGRFVQPMAQNVLILISIFAIPRALTYCYRLSRMHDLGSQSMRIAAVVVACLLRIAGFALTTTTLLWIMRGLQGVTIQEFISTWAIGCTLFAIALLTELACWYTMYRTMDKHDEMLSGYSAVEPLESA